MKEHSEECNDMVQIDQPDKSTQCAVYDQTPDSEQKKINIVVRPAHTVAKVISNIKTQYRYDNFELVLQPNTGGDLVYLNERKSELIYKIDEFEPKAKNILVLLPTGKWDGNVKTRFNVPKPTSKLLTNGNVGKMPRKLSPSASKSSKSPVVASVTPPTVTPKSSKSPVVASVTPPTVTSESSKSPVVASVTPPTATPKSSKTPVVASVTPPTVTPKSSKSPVVASVTPPTVTSESSKSPVMASVTPPTATVKSSKSPVVASVTPPTVTSESSKLPVVASVTPPTVTTPAPPIIPIPPPPPPPPPSVTAAAPLPAPTKSKTTKIKHGKKCTVKLDGAISKNNSKVHALNTEVNTNGLPSGNAVATNNDSRPIGDDANSLYTAKFNNLASSMSELNGQTSHDQHQSMTNSNSVNDLINHDVGMSPPSSMTTVTNATNSDSLNLSPMSEPDPLSDDDLALGASASPTEGDSIKLADDLDMDGKSSTKQSAGSFKRYFEASNRIVEQEKKYPLSPLPGPLPTAIATNNGLVGLVNQAMTCYLNSLLQALYMTPEFRNALYRWEFDHDNEAKNIPYQLQKLFLNLQTSKKSAVETTDLTRSFGWNSSEAWQQHDIQELCRVMFDALEHKFKNTKQANLIANLYEGKMLDYVKCLECNTEKQRADTFLDIPLPVRPFGSQTAYGSIEEALRAFVQPETLDGNNQYFCEKCNKKCDAHKGLKFKNFPYVLTLHLKRFDFDYSTMHRIKLNDKVTFPQILNLNTFVASSDTDSVQTNGLDDCSTTDSGSAMEEDNLSSGVATTASYATQNDNDINEEDTDEGIDTSSNMEHRIRANGEQDSNLDRGPFTYELFAIMIHSGSASGGHYYAYIKDFDNNDWFCFNDQTVSPITQEDIQKSFGGNTSKAYYSSVYSSSTNAYMLMYRQVDKERNENSVKSEEFPEHITKLVQKLKEEEDTRGNRGSLRHRPIADLSLPEQIKPRVYFYNPQLKKLKMTRIYVTQKFDINTVLESAYEMLSVKQFAPLANCRLVGYDPTAERIIRSFEDVTDPSLTDIRANSEDTLEFLLEYRTDDQKFEIYEPGGITWYVYLVKLPTMEMDGPFFVYSKAIENDDTLRHSIVSRLSLNEELVTVKTTQRYKRAFVTYDAVPTKENQAQLEELVRLQFKNITYLYLNVPNTDPKNLELIGIPACELQEQINDALVDGGIVNDLPLPSNGESPKLSNGFHHECNSEDSSLSDGDRTLVENLQRHSGGDGGAEGGDSQFSSTSHSPQLSSPEDENNQDSLNRINAFYNGYSHGDSDQLELPPQRPQFFHAIKLDVMDTITASSRSNYSEADAADDAAHKPVVSYKILVDSHMKLSKFKEHVQHLIKVPDIYFQINRKHDISLKGSMNQSLLYFSDGETLSVDLGKELQPDEHRAKISYMRMSEFTNETGRLQCVCEWIFTDATMVLEAKSALISKLQRIDPIKYKTLCMDNIRLWLNGGRRPIKIFADDDLLSNTLRSANTVELIVQECDEGQQPQPADTSLTIFIRRWHPDTLQLGKFEEITLDERSEIRNVLSKYAGIVEENVAYTKVKGTFPYTSVSLLTINTALNWYSIPATVENYPLTSTTCGDLYFYKDASVEPMELTSEERRKFSAKEKTRLDRLGCISSSRFSPRRERALKIYLDSPVATASPPVDANSSMLDE